MYKLVIIINGRGGVGKDTLINSYISHNNGGMNITSKQPIVDILKPYLNEDDKSDKARKLIVDVKKALVEYDDIPTKYLFTEFRTFLNTDHNILFVHIREAEEIDKFKNLIKSHCNVITLLVDNGSRKYYGNSSDDNVDKYDYDIVFRSIDGDIAGSCKMFNDLVDSLIN